MKKIICLVLLCPISYVAYPGVSIDWMKTAVSANEGTAIAVDSIDNVYTTSHGVTIYLEKHDRFGNYLWHINSPCSFPFNYEIAKHI